MVIKSSIYEISFLSQRLPQVLHIMFEIHDFPSLFLLSSLPTYPYLIQFNPFSFFYDLPSFISYFFLFYFLFFLFLSFLLCLMCNFPYFSSSFSATSLFQLSFIFSFFFLHLLNSMTFFVDKLSVFIICFLHFFPFLSSFLLFLFTLTSFLSPFFLSYISFSP